MADSNGNKPPDGDDRERDNRLAGEALRNYGRREHETNEEAWARIRANSDPATNAAFDRLMADPDYLASIGLYDQAQKIRQNDWEAGFDAVADLPEPDWDDIAARAAAETAAHPVTPSAHLEPTGWEPADLEPLLEGNAPDDSPRLYKRTDKQAILYPGKLHYFVGEPESLKTWGALLAVKQEINQGHEVWYFDFEDNPRTIVARLLFLGAHVHHLRECFRYFHPDQPLTDQAVEVLRDLARDIRPSLAVIDGVTEAMAVFGLDLMSNRDIATFIGLLPRRLAKAGAAVILVDHVVKDREQRGRWAIGGQHKMAGTDVSLTFELIQPAGRGLHGIARLVIHKDRPGWLRQHAAGRTLAELHLDSHEMQGDIGPAVLVTTCELKPADSAITEAGFRPSRVMEKISRALEHSAALTTRALRAKTGGQNEPDTWQLAVETLANEGFITITRQGSARWHAHVTAFRADAESDENGHPEQF